MSIEPARRDPGRRLLEPDRRERRPELPRAGGARPLPELPGLRHGRPGLLRPPGPRGLPRRVVRAARAARRRGRRSTTSALLIFRLGGEWLALSLSVVVEVTALRPVHRIPHRTNQVVLGPGEPPGPVAALRLAARSARRRPGRPGRRPFGEPADGRDPQGVRDLGLPGRGGRRRPAGGPGPAPEGPLDPGQPGRQLQPGRLRLGHGRSVGVLDEPRVFESLRRMGQ